MNIKSEKGITGIDITVATIVITIFISLIGVLIYSLGSGSKSIKRRTEATYQAVNIIEELKSKEFDSLENEQGYIENTPYYKEIIVVDYKDLNEENQNNNEIRSGILKQVKVIISYKDGNKTEKIELSTAISKGS